MVEDKPPNIKGSGQFHFSFGDVIGIPPKFVKDELDLAE